MKIIPLFLALTLSFPLLSQVDNEGNDMDSVRKGIEDRAYEYFKEDGTPVDPSLVTPSEKEKREREELRYDLDDDGRIIEDSL